MDSRRRPKFTCMGSTTKRAPRCPFILSATLKPFAESAPKTTRGGVPAFANTASSHSQNAPPCPPWCSAEPPRGSLLANGSAARVATDQGPQRLKCSRLLFLPTLHVAAMTPARKANGAVEKLRQQVADELVFGRDRHHVCRKNERSKWQSAKPFAPPVASGDGFSPTQTSAVVFGHLSKGC